MKNKRDVPLATLAGPSRLDHERLSGRIGLARASSAHGDFEAYAPMTAFTRAAPFQAAGKIAPVFTRYSPVAGERGATDTACDIRGLAVKFFTDEGSWDLVGNNIPVTLVQDAVRFPDLVCAVKADLPHGTPEANAAHDAFWERASLMPGTTHSLMWMMSHRGIPRSLRLMRGFGVCTYRLVNAKGESHVARFHWKPRLGRQSLVWGEAVKISGADPDFHRRDLWEAIESGEYPEWELGLQIFAEAQAARFTFDVLDVTKLIPDELVPATPVGRMVLDRNADDLATEAVQGVFRSAPVLPGIDTGPVPPRCGQLHPAPALPNGGGEGCSFEVGAAGHVSGG